MNLNQYETVFILTPILSEEQMKDTVEKFRKIIIDGGAEIVHQEDWGLKKLAYPIKKKNTGFYTIIEFKSSPEFIKTLEIEYKRDEKVMRHLIVSLDKFAVAYSEKRRNKKATETKSENE